MLHKVTKSVGYQIFSQGLQLPCSAIAADPWNIFTPPGLVAFGSPTAMQKDTRALSSGLQKHNTTAKNPAERGTKTRWMAHYLVPSATLDRHDPSAQCEGNDLQNCFRETAYWYLELSVPKKSA